MCGIAGILDFRGRPIRRDILDRMSHELIHRGPDDAGVYQDGSIALVHRRLSILDLSFAGHQPMCNEDGTLWLTFNGEIYNYRDLSSQLRSKGHIFKSETDSEVIIHAYEEWGEDCLRRFNGMWAFGLWDSRKKRLFSARDRFGIKPFYYFLDDNRFVFSSEIRPIFEDSDIPRSQNDRAVFDYLAYENNCYLDHTEETFFKGIMRLMPAHYMIVDSSGGRRVSRYWDLDPQNRLEHVPDDQAAQAFYDLFQDSVRLRLQSDVALGTCLSGGLDSSAIVCMVNRLMQQSGAKNKAVGSLQKTFSAAFDDKACDESHFIKAITEETNLETNIVFPEREHLLDLIPSFMEDQGEPVTGTSQLAGWLVMRMVKERGVKVVLNGQGADEILAGYQSYFVANFKDLFRGLKLGKLANEICRYSEHHGYSKKWLARDLISHFNPIHPFRWKRRLLGDEEPSIFPRWLSKDFVSRFGRAAEPRAKYRGYMDQSLYHFLTYERLPSLLRFEDRNSMAFSIEARLPFLDYRLVEYCFSLPSEQKIRNGAGKVVMRNALKEVLPAIVHQRIKKIGFHTPERTWFRSTLRRPIEDIIGSQSFRERGYFDSSAVSDHYKRFLKHDTICSSTIWHLFNLELWLRQAF
ncbi:asparagine synthase (glutamine-hydrolyzing) [Elusimicrobiota bacterium]